ncbi:MAG: M3 family oligoendopeptidase [Flavobacteriales bacterium]|nr:M3 family oligoendopeptidase [Flavobacteriales bacterium]
MPVLDAPVRRYLPEAIALGDAAAVTACFDELRVRALVDVNALQRWLEDLSELEAALEEEGAWRYIRMTLDTTDKTAGELYRAFTAEVLPVVELRMDELHRRLVEVPFLDQVEIDGMSVYLRGIKGQLRIFREENVPIQVELRDLAQQYSGTIGAMSIEWEGETITLPKAAALLESTDRAEREAVYRLMAARRLQDATALDDLFTNMVAKRNAIAGNAEFSNFRDYAYASLGRFDHAPSDAMAFHAAVQEHVVPLVDRLHHERKEALGVDSLRPWDLQVDTTGKPPLRPFDSDDRLIDLAVEVFGKVHPYFAECLRTMRTMGRLDLGSRTGKAPGGYNYPLYETGAPFIFMNAVGTTDDVITMFHEGGHAVHSFLTHPLRITGSKSFPSEVAELASMSMELLTMDHWHLVYPDEDDLRRAKRDQLERVLTILPWVATVDAFQHAVYLNPGMSAEERHGLWRETFTRFAGEVVDHSGLEKERDHLWHKQLHIFELPFYYIEYGIAQLGAIAIWRNYKREPAAAVEAYMNALRAGYTKPLPELYALAGIRFDLSPAYIRDLAAFINEELSALGS